MSTAAPAFGLVLAGGASTRMQRDKAARDLSFTVLKAEIPAADVPSPPEDSLENRYQFIRYVEKTQNIRILRAAL